MAITPKTRRTIWERDGGICGICGEPVPWADTDIDHIRARKILGGDEPENLQTAHPLCNRRKAAQDKIEAASVIAAGGEVLPTRPRLDLRTDADVEAMFDWMTEHTGYTRPQVIRYALWYLGTITGVENMPPLSRLLNVRPGRKPKAPTPPTVEAPNGRE